MNLLAAVATVAFTLPIHDSGMNCVDSTSTLHDLDSVWVMQHVWGDGKPARAVYTARVRGMEGQALSVDVPADTVAEVWVVTSDTLHNRSCIAMSIWIGGPVSVGDAPRKPPGFYDVAGRRVDRPTIPGIYWEVFADKPRRLRIR